jgi:hypothetical protein
LYIEFSATYNPGLFVSDLSVSDLSMDEVEDLICGRALKIRVNISFTFGNLHELTDNCI